MVQVRVGGQFNRSSSCAPCRSAAVRATSCKLGDIAEIKRGYVDPPAVKVRHQGKEVIALGVSMAKGGDIIALGKALEAASDHQRRPARRRRAGAGAGPAAWRSSSSVNEFVGVLIEAVAIVLAVSFIALGLHQRRRFGAGMSTCGPGWWWRSRFRWCWR